MTPRIGENKLCLSMYTTYVCERADTILAIASISFSHFLVFYCVSWWSCASLWVSKLALRQHLGFVATLQVCTTWDALPPSTTQHSKNNYKKKTRSQSEFVQKRKSASGSLPCRISYHGVRRMSATTIRYGEFRQYNGNDENK